jgi:hypothetical protein
LLADIFLDASPRAAKVTRVGTNLRERKFREFKSAAMEYVSISNKASDRARSTTASRCSTLSLISTRFKTHNYSVSKHVELGNAPTFLD